MRTEPQRARQARRERKVKRYPSDLIDQEWQTIEPLLPSPAGTGRRRTTELREVLNAIRYLVRSGCRCGVRPLQIVRRGNDAWIHCSGRSQAGRSAHLYSAASPLVVERSFGWMVQWRRLVRNYEGRIDVSSERIYVAMGSLLPKRLFENE